MLAHPCIGNIVDSFVILCQHTAYLCFLNQPPSDEPTCLILNAINAIHLLSLGVTCRVSGFPSQASVDSRVIVRELREETMELRQLPQLGLDDGVGLWRHLCHGLCWELFDAVWINWEIWHSDIVEVSSFLCRVLCIIKMEHFANTPS